MPIPVNFEDLITPITEEQALPGVIERAEDIGLPASTWRPGDFGYTFLRLIAWLSSRGSSWVSELARAQFMRLQTSDKMIDAYAAHRFDETRVPATKTRWKLLLDNGGINTKTKGPRSTWVKVNGQLYQNVDAFSVAAGEKIKVEFEAEKAEALKSSASGAGAWVTSVAGVTISADTADILSEGRNLESNESFFRRCIMKWATLAMHPGDNAYKFHILTGIKGVPVEVSAATRAELLDKNGRGAFTIYCASYRGGLTEPEVEKVRSLVGFIDDFGAIPSVASAIEQVVNVTGTVYYTGKLETVKAAVEAEIVKTFSEIDIGGTIIDTLPRWRPEELSKKLNAVKGVSIYIPSWKEVRPDRDNRVGVPDYSTLEYVKA